MSIEKQTTYFEVTADAEISYSFDCPQCGGYINSDYQNDWDLGVNNESTVEIECTDCNTKIDVNLPD